MKKRDTILYFPGLNGLRAISALAVVIGHITLELKKFNIDPVIWGISDNRKHENYTIAGFSVSIFFVLSGFLITYLLQTEKEQKQIDVKKFYIRRILRIWPLYYLYLTLAIISIFAFGLYFNTKLLLLYTFFFANIPFILGIDLPFVGHYWSLGVEEQFYLFWPWVNKKINSINTFIITSLIFLIGTKVLLHLFYPHSILELTLHVTRFHCMLIGAAGAMILKRNMMYILDIIDNKFSQIICWVTFGFVFTNNYHIISVIDNEIISVVTICIVIGQIRVRNRIVNLETTVFNFLGKISFGIYVIHPLIIFFLSILFSQFKLSGVQGCLTIYLSVISTTIIFSYLSYRYIETFFLKLKTKYSVVSSSSTNIV